MDENRSLRSHPIPIIDFEPFLVGDESAKQAVAQQIYQAFDEFGFLYLKNYGFTEGSVERLLTQAKRFFDLPPAIKNKIRRSEKTNCGYVGFQAERLNPARSPDLKEALNIGSASTWLPEMEEFRATIYGFYQVCIDTLADKVLRAIALSLDLPESFFVEKHGENYFLRLLHYPAFDQPLAADQMRAGEHTDYGSITLLFQDPVGGLEIRVADQWIAAPYIPETVVINIGDAMQRWTNNRFRSTPHRVVLTEGQEIQSRYSTALFCDPNPDVEISCLPICQSSDRPPQYAPIRFQDYLESRFAATYRPS
ncbi:MAG: isopenicillin N synthase family oxygenase [Oculatellaceae cyanobacterium Prado106]|nr:isopenicillin N synthase family oxygenase [Oculatellaceae cyanobacterium Prado106]